MWIEFETLGRVGQQPLGGGRRPGRGHAGLDQLGQRNGPEQLLAIQPSR